MVGTAVALSNALGLNRDPSSWAISSSEKSLRIRIWWLVILHDRWCSLAYGTPLQVHRAQYNVPFPSVNDICSENASPYQRSAASIFVALVSLTDVLARYLECVFHVAEDPPASEPSATYLEQILNNWEESLSDDVRRIVLRGTCLDEPGAANFRLSYLAVKLLLRRIQLDLKKSSAQIEDDTASPFYILAQRSAEEVAFLMQELEEAQLHGFWIPVHAFSITSATMFLIRSGLRLKGQNRNRLLNIAQGMINTLRAHRESFDWDLGDHCLAQCSELVERIHAKNVQAENGTSTSGLLDISENLDLDPIILEELFGVSSGLEGLFGEIS
ncbi:hypothetical protein N7462_006268 [Penicillium macrosclerotiorum]|uniref:uncharacterized protein n=1 Tax=Penicillium macrosclerotiorum TaxID=303699 RepID=UPI0025478700|nr:uncharacterized protein N7462_006268 [Penicillium macrosclerotiorum]KAJ5683103.1 hypothetical protein N7462_006268 [Penicillium macrosclerotiorum]